MLGYSVRPNVGQMLFANKESDVGRGGKAIWSGIAPRKDRMACLERVEDGAQRDWSLHLEQDLCVHPRQPVLVI